MQNGKGKLSGEGDSPHARLKSNYAQERVKNVDTAEAKFKSLEKIIYTVHLLSDKEQTEHFDVFSSHLQSPMNSRRFETKMAFPLALYSLMGIVNLGSSYFGRGSAHNERFLACWPHILKCLKSIIDGRHFFACEEKVFEVAAQVFRLASSVDEAALGKDDAFELAVIIWNGCTTQGGKDCFAGQPLLTCLCYEIEDDNRMKYITNGYKNDPERLVDKILSRVKYATFQSSQMDVQTISCLTSLMEILEARRKRSNLIVIFSPRTGPFMVTVINALVNAPGASESAGHIGAARMSCRIVFHCIQLGPAWARQIVEAGVLDPLLKVASIKDSESGSQQSPCDVLWALLRSLLYDDVVVACQQKLCDLHTGGQEFNDLLKTSSYQFHRLWRMFELGVLEQSVLLHLFDVGFAPEVGMCANLACCKEALRSQFKKCSRCGFAIYCSKSCQGADWSYHKDGCKKAAKESPDAIAKGFGRFPYRVVSLQINRHFAPLSLMSLGKRIRSQDLAFRIDYTTFQFQIIPFDQRELLDDSKHPARHVMVVNEIQRRSAQKEKGDCVMVVLRLGETELPFVINLASAFEGRSKKIPGVPFIDVLEHDELPMFKDGHGEPLVGMDIDALRATARYALKYSKDLGVPVWSEKVLKKAALSVIGEFDEELRGYASAAAGVENGNGNKSRSEEE